MKAGIWTKRNKGLVVLETLICLAVLILLLPMAHRFILISWKKYDQTSLKEQAVLIAQLELSRLEIEITRGNFRFSRSDNANAQFSIDRRVKEEMNGLKKICVEVKWQTSRGPQRLALEQWIFLGRAEEYRAGLRTEL